MLLSEQIAETLTERQSHQIDKDWTAGIRRWWNTEVGAAKRYPGRIETSTFLDSRAVIANGEAAHRALDRLSSALDRLKDDLYVNKGFWQPGQTPISKDDRKFGGVPKVWREKVASELEAANEAISNHWSMIRHWMMTADEATPEHFGKSAYPEVFKDEAGWNRLTRTIGILVDEGADLAHAAVDRLLRFLSKLAGKSADALSVSAETVPDVVDVQGAKLIFDPLPSPARAARMKQDDWTPPINRRWFVEQLIKAKALLQKRGLGFLWYGEFQVKPKGQAPTNPLGAHFGTGAQYWIGQDRVEIFQQHGDIDVLVAHELGHRLWYKFLTQGQRAGFAAYFKDVKAVSEYGETKAEEDFAEVFSYYIDGRGLTSDQVERFKAFTKGKWKMESHNRRRHPLSFELAEAISGGSANVATTPLAKARAFAQDLFTNNCSPSECVGSIDKVLPDFDKNYLALQKLVKSAPNIKRIDMPVIEPSVMSRFHDDLAAGRVDIFKPFAKGKLHVPRRMSPEEGAEWVTLGIKDGDEMDDRIQAAWGRTAAGKLKPTQNEIWFDKIVRTYVKHGLPKTGSQATEMTLIVTREGYIIDGHHRWAQVFFADPSMTLSTLRVPLDLETLLAIGRSYGAALGYEPKA